MADLRRDDLPLLDWGVAQRAASLQAVFAHASGLAGEAERWYAAKRPAKSWWGRALRILAIVLGVAAAVLPVLSQLTEKGDGTGGIAPGWATIALAVAAGLILLDHYFGFSTGWSRFMAAELELTRLRHNFQYEWNLRQARTHDPPDDGDVADLLAIAETLVLAVDDAIAKETGQWVTEFQGSLQRTEAGLAAGPGPTA